jgi:hypothetical protein
MTKWLLLLGILGLAGPSPEKERRWAGARLGKGSERKCPVGVLDVGADSAFFRMGVRRGDALCVVEGRKVESLSQAAWYLRAPGLSSDPVVDVTVKRAGRTMELSGKLPAEPGDEERFLRAELVGTVLTLEGVDFRAGRTLLAIGESEPRLAEAKAKYAPSLRVVPLSEEKLGAQLPVSVLPTFLLVEQGGKVVDAAIGDASAILEKASLGKKKR